jgi:hypothetical protein
MKHDSVYDLVNSFRCLLEISECEICIMKKIMGDLMDKIVYWNWKRFQRVVLGFGELKIDMPEIDFEGVIWVEGWEQVVSLIDTCIDLSCDDRRWEHLFDQISQEGSIRETLLRLFTVESAILIHKGKAFKKIRRWKVLTRLKDVSNNILKKIWKLAGFGETYRWRVWDNLEESESVEISTKKCCMSRIKDLWFWRVRPPDKSVLEGFIKFILYKKLYLSPRPPDIIFNHKNVRKSLTMSKSLEKR